LKRNKEKSFLMKKKSSPVAIFFLTNNFAGGLGGTQPIEFQ
jgi:hypothetical protein